MGLAYALGATKIGRLAIISFGLSAMLFFGFTELLQLPLPFGFEFLSGDTASDEEW
jgi:hypothetical protein